jgi:hypothetical protein
MNVNKAGSFLRALDRDGSPWKSGIAALHPSAQVEWVKRTADELADTNAKQAQEITRLRAALKEAIPHAKRAWFAGRIADNGDALGEYPLPDFNDVQTRLKAALDNEQRGPEQET